MDGSGELDLGSESILADINVYSVYMVLMHIYSTIIMRRGKKIQGKYSEIDAKVESKVWE